MGVTPTAGTNEEHPVATEPGAVTEPALNTMSIDETSTDETSTDEMSTDEALSAYLTWLKLFTDDIDIDKVERPEVSNEGAGIVSALRGSLSPKNGAATEKKTIIENVTDEVKADVKYVRSAVTHAMAGVSSSADDKDSVEGKKGIIEIVTNEVKKDVKKVSDLVKPNTDDEPTSTESASIEI